MTDKPPYLAIEARWPAHAAGDRRHWSEPDTGRRHFKVNAAHSAVKEAKRLGQSLYNSWPGAKLDGAGATRIVLHDAEGTAIVANSFYGSDADMIAKDAAKGSAYVREQNDRMEAYLEARSA
jgi:hypothetical protein